MAVQSFTSTPSASSLLRRRTVILLLLAAVIACVLVSSIPTRVGLISYITSHYPFFVGAIPVFSYGVEPGYTFKQLYEDNNLSGKTALVTGGNSGIGFEIALALARLGASVTLACRNENRCNNAAEKIRADDRISVGTVDTKIVDFSSLASVRDFSIAFKEGNNKLDVIFLNAGVGSAGMKEDGSPSLSVDGIEKVFATNLVGHHLLFKYLQPLLSKSEKSRVVLTSSYFSFLSHDTPRIATNLESLNSLNYKDDPINIYAQSKLGQIYWAQEVTRILGSDSGVHVNAFSPGSVSTPIWEKSPIPDTIGVIKAFIMNQAIRHAFENDLMWDVTDASLTGLYLGVSEEVVSRDIRGKYFHPVVQEVANPFAQDEELQAKLWGFLDQLVEGYLPDNEPNIGLPVQANNLVRSSTSYSGGYYDGSTVNGSTLVENCLPQGIAFDLTPKNDDKAALALRVDDKANSVTLSLSLLFIVPVSLLVVASRNTTRVIPTTEKIGEDLIHPHNWVIRFIGIVLEYEVFVSLCDPKRSLQAVEQMIL